MNVFTVWHYLDHGLGEAKASFGIVKLSDGYFDDPNCTAQKLSNLTQ